MVSYEACFCWIFVGCFWDVNLEWYAWYTEQKHGQKMKVGSTMPPVPTPNGEALLHLLQLDENCVLAALAALGKMGPSIQPTRKALVVSWPNFHTRPSKVC